jgi:hypothetical protein
VHDTCGDGFSRQRSVVALAFSQRATHTGACWTTMFRMYRSSNSRFFASAFDSAFFRRRVMNLTDFSGQRPMIQLMFRLPILLSSYSCSLHTLGRLELLGLRSAANATSEPTERNDLLVVGDITKVSVGLGQLKTYQQSGTSSLQYSTSAKFRNWLLTHRSARPPPHACS